MKAEIEVSKLLIEGRNRVDIFMYRPENVACEHLGNLFIIGEIESIGRKQKDDFFVLNSIASIVKKTYYHTISGTPEDNLELALKQVNNQIDQLTSRELSSIRETFHFIVAAVADRAIYFSKTGDSEIVLVRGSNWLNIGHAEADNDVRQRYKFFSDIISGQLNDRDILLFFTPRLAPFLSQESMRNKLASRQFDTEHASIQKYLLTVDPVTSQACVQLQIHLNGEGSEHIGKTILDLDAEPEPEPEPETELEPQQKPKQTPEPKPSLKKIGRKSEEVPEVIEATEPSEGSIEHFMQQKPPARSPSTHKDRGAAVKAAFASVARKVREKFPILMSSLGKRLSLGFTQALKTIKDKFQSAKLSRPDVQTITGQLHPAGMRLREGTRQVSQIFGSVKRNASSGIRIVGSRLSQLMQRIIDRIKTIRNARTTGTTPMSRPTPMPHISISRSSGAPSKTRFYALVGLFILAIIMLAGALIYQQQLKGQIQTNLVKQQGNQAKLDQLLTDKRTKTIRLTDDDIAIRFTTLSLNKPFSIRTGFIRTDASPRLILVGDESVYFADETTDIDGIFIRYSADLKPATGAALLTTTNQLLLYSVESPNTFVFMNLKTGDITTDNIELDAPIQAIAEFNNRVYALTQNQIYRFGVSTGVPAPIVDPTATTTPPAPTNQGASLSLVNPAAWLGSEESSALLAPLSLAIDGSVYVLDSNTTITKYRAGEKVLDIPIGNLFTLDQRNARLATGTIENKQYLAVLNPSEQSVIIYTTEGDLVHQLRHQSFETAHAALFDDVNNEILIFLEKQVVAVPSSTLQP